MHNQLENLRTACFGIGYTYSVERWQEIVAPAVIDSRGDDDKVLLNMEPRRDKERRECALMLYGRFRSLVAGRHHDHGGHAEKEIGLEYSAYCFNPWIEPRPRFGARLHSLLFLFTSERLDLYSFL
ncbi:hypothetical protein BHE74_00006864 [Ensete ventricosum]|nr:hypothetical protein BHE74_00006864 [Ensete ventricosum]RZR79807.1 hypothetical protein BHM03_00005643 [Ensete ventricosum]